MNRLVDQLVAEDDNDLVIATRGPIRILVFNRPSARNAMTVAMRKEFARQIAAADADDDVLVTVVTGAGGVFSAGVDIKELRAGVPPARPHPAEALRAAAKPVIAAVDGPCATGGLELALSCSFILASPSARFADTHAKVGLIAGWGMSALLPRAIGRRRANQIMSTGAFIDAKTAYDWGLVNEIIDEDVLARAVEVAESMAGNPQVSVRMQIKAMYDSDGETLEEALAIEERMRDAWRAARDA